MPSLQLVKFPLECLPLSRPPPFSLLINALTPIAYTASFHTTDTPHTQFSSRTCCGKTVVHSVVVSGRCSVRRHLLAYTNSCILLFSVSLLTPPPLQHLGNRVTQQLVSPQQHLFLLLPLPSSHLLTNRKYWKGVCHKGCGRNRSPVWEGSILRCCYWALGEQQPVDTGRSLHPCLLLLIISPQTGEWQSVWLPRCPLLVRRKGGSCQLHQTY